MMWCLEVVKFSIVIPIGPGRKAEVVGSLEKLDYPKKDYEVIVKHGLNPSRNRNDGVKDAKADIVLFLDDDAFVDRDLLKNAEKIFEKYENTDVVGGPQLTPKTDGFFARMSGYAFGSFFATHNMSNRYSKGRFNLNADEMSMTSAVLFVKKKVFEKVQFDTRLFPGEDPDFLARVKKAGFRMVYSPNIFIYHKRRRDFKSFFKQFYLYGKTRLQKEKYGNTLIKPIYLVPLLFVLYIVSLPVIVFLSWIFVVPLLFYIVIAYLFSFYEAVKHGKFILFFVLPFFYFFIHLSYGVGTLSGLFFNRIK